MLAARARPRENGHLYTRTLEREHMMDADKNVSYTHKMLPTNREVSASVAEVQANTKQSGVQDQTSE